MTAEPVRATFRAAVRESALRAAQELTVAKGWARVRMAEVAERTGVSRPTLYKEFGDKQRLGEALVLAETERFLTGVAGVLARHDGDVRAAITAAVTYTLDEAVTSPLLRAVLTSAHPGDDDLLPLLTTRSRPVLDAAGLLVRGWLHEQQPRLDRDHVASTADVLVRLAVSHIVLPDEDSATSAASLADIALRLLGLAEH